MNRYERRKFAIEDAKREQAKAIRDLYELENTEKRDLTDEERLEVESHVKALETLREEEREVDANIKTLTQVDDITGKIGPAVPPLESVHHGSGGGVEFTQGYGPVPGGNPFEKAVKSIGAQLIESKGFKSVVDRWGMEGKHTFSAGIEVKAGTLTEAATLGAGMIPVPQVLPGITFTRFQRLTVEDLLDSGQATTNSIRYVVEGTATSGAVGVAEGAPKPTSQLGFSTVDEPVKKIATSIVVSDEMLEDVTQVQSVINSRLSIFVQNRVEVSLINGSGTNDLVGFLQAGRGINSIAKSGTDNSAETLFKAINGARGSAQLEPDAILMSPSAYQNIRLLRDAAGGTAGQYMGGGPFQYGPYGVGAPAMASNQVTGQTGPNDLLWGKPVYVTSALSAGSALVITRAGAQVFNRGGMAVEASNSGFLGGQDLFNSNLVQIRAERRLALALYRPAAFVLCTGL